MTDTDLLNAARLIKDACENREHCDDCVFRKGTDGCIVCDSPIPTQWSFDEKLEDEI